MATRDELVAALVDRYAEGSRTERGLILDELVAVTKFHRKHATRLLKGGTRGRPLITVRSVAVMTVSMNRPGRCASPMAPRPGLAAHQFKPSVRSRPDFYGTAWRLGERGPKR